MNPPLVERLVTVTGMGRGDLRAHLAAFRRAVAAQASRARRRADGKAGLLAWSRRYLARHFQLPPSAMHRWLAAQLDSFRDRRGTRLNVIGPRGSAKSTIATLAWPLWAALEASEPYVWIVCDTRRQAIAHLENLRIELETNEALREDYPEAIGPGFRAREGKLVLASGATVEAFGSGQRIRGRRQGRHRPSTIIADDVQNDGHILSARMRQRSREWFHGMLLPAGDPQTNVVHLATALHREALAIELLSAAGWESKVFASIDPWPARGELWEQWESIYTQWQNPEREVAARAFYEDRRAEMDEGAGVLWPEREGLYELMRERAQMGRGAFQREKQGQPASADACEFPEEYFAEPLWFLDWPPRLRLRVVAIDPSKGRSDRLGDYTAIVMLGVTNDGLLLVEADLARRPTPEIVATAAEWCERYRPDALGIESNQFQELLRDELEAELQRRGLAALAPWAIDNRLNKNVRIRRLGPLLCQKRFRFRHGSAGTRMLVRQLQEFPLAEHDDGPDALEMAVRLAQALSSPRPADGLGELLV